MTSLNLPYPLYFKLVTPAVLEKHQKKSVKEAEANIQNAFHCKTPDCAGWTVTEDDVNIFKCPLCKRTNCITCQVKLSVSHNLHFCQESKQNYHFL